MAAAIHGFGESGEGDQSNPKVKRGSTKPLDKLMGELAMPAKHGDDRKRPGQGDASPWARVC